MCCIISVKYSLFSRLAVGYYISNNPCPLGEGRTVSVRGKPREKELWKRYVRVPVTQVSVALQLTDTIQTYYTFRH
jgi:hypothetical protein